MAIYTLLLFTFWVNANASDRSFKDCSSFINNDVEFEVFGNDPRGHQILNFTEAGDLKVIAGESAYISCFNQCAGQKVHDQMVVSTPNDGVDKWLKRNKLPSINSKDSIIVSKDTAGNVAHIQIDKLTGGRGASINGNSYQYYHEVDDYDFSYDSKGCFPAKKTSYLYAGKDQSKPTEKINFEKCKNFEKVYSNLPKKFIQATKYLEPVLPPPENLRRQLADAILTFGPFSDEFNETINSLGDGKTSDQRHDWSTGLGLIDSVCGDQRRGSDPGDIQFFLQARSSHGTPSSSNAVTPRTESPTAK